MPERNLITLTVVQRAGEVLVEGRIQTGDPGGTRIIRVGGKVGGMPAVGVLGQEVGFVGLGTVTPDIVVRILDGETGRTLEQHVDVKARIGEVQVQTVLDRRVRTTGPAVRQAVVTVDDTVTVHIFIDEGAREDLGVTKVAAHQRSGLQLLEAGVTALIGLIEPTVTVQTVGVVVLPAVIGTVVLATLTIEVHAASVGKVSADIIVHLADVAAGTNLELDTLVLGRLEVLLRETGAEGARDRHDAAGEFTGIHAAEPFDGAVQFAAPGLEVDTDVHDPGRDPGEVVQRHTRSIITRGDRTPGENIAVGDAGGVCGDILPGAAGIKTGFTVGSTDLEVVDSRENVLEERLFGDTPTNGGRREEGPPHLRGVAVGTVVTADQLQQVLALVVVIRTEDIGGQAGETPVTAVGSRGGRRLVQNVIREDIGIVTGAGQVVTPGAGHFGQGGGADVVVAELVGIGELRAAIELLIDVHRTAVGLGGVEGGQVVVRLEVVQRVGLGQARVVAVAAVEGREHAGRHSLQEREGVAEFGIGIIGHVPVAAVTRDVGILQAFRVLAFRIHLGHVVRVLAGMLRIDRERMGTAEVGDEGFVVPFELFLRLLTLSPATGETGNEREVARQVYRQVRTEGVPLIILGVELFQTVIVVVAEADEVAHIVGTAPNGDVVILLESERLQVGAHPVEI